MKKFLSILLALAVGFTFTFGSAMSAFAATSTETPADEYTANQTTLTKEYNDCVSKLSAQYVQDFNSITDITIDKSVYEKIAKEVYDTYMSVLEAQNALNDFNTALNDVDKYGDLNGKSFTDVNTQAKFNALVLSTDSTPANNPYLDKTMELAFDGYKDYVIAELNKINLALYADKEMTDADYNAAASVAASSAVTTGNLYKTTYKQYVTDLRDKTITEVKAIGIEQLTAANKTTRVGKAYADVHAKMAILDTTATAGTESVYYTVSGKNIFVSYALASAQKVPTIKAQEQNALTDDAKMAGLKAIVDSNAATHISNNSATADTAKAAKKLADAYKEVMYSRIENEDLDSFTNATFGDKIPAVSDNFNAIKKNYTALETEAATLKVMVDATGALIYDAKIIDKNLEKGKIAIYKTTGAVTHYELTTGAKLSEQSLDWTKESKIATLKAEMEDALYEVNGDAKYYDLEQKEIEKLYQKQIDKINAATTTDQLIAIPATVAIPATITNKANTIIAIKALTQFTTDQAKLAKYVDLLNGDTKSWEAGYKAMMDNDTLADFYATNNARTNAEVAALFDTAKAECDKLPTKGEIAAAKAAAEEIVKALPAYITLENKDAVEAAYKAVAELDDNYGVAPSNKAKLDNAITKLKNALLVKLDADVKALPSKPTAADKAAVEALLEEIDAYETSDMYKSIASPAAYPTYANKATVITVATKVRDAALADVIAAIAALPTDATKEQVEAVRKTYDAFVKDYTDAAGTNHINVISGVNTPYKAADRVTNYDKLAYLEAKIKEANKFTDADVKAYVFDQAAKATSVKLGAKKVKVTANFDASKLVENGYTVEYKFYKSTKKSSGYKYTGVTKPADNATYTNTNAKKGKNYYKFKVVVKNADGTVILTTALKDCKYACRTIK